jgi:hypothetical protein
MAFDLGLQALDREPAGRLVRFERCRIAQQVLDARLPLLVTRRGVEPDPSDRGRLRRGRRGQALRFRLRAQCLDLRHAARRAFLAQAPRVVGGERGRSGRLGAARARLLQAGAGRRALAAGGAAQRGDFLPQRGQARADGGQPRQFLAQPQALGGGVQFHQYCASLDALAERRRRRHYLARHRRAKHMRRAAHLQPGPRRGLVQRHAAEHEPAEPYQQHQAGAQPCQNGSARAIVGERSGSRKKLCGQGASFT